MAGAARGRDAARYALAGVRLFSGAAALLAPAKASRSFGVDTDGNSSTLYVLRLFGIRTVLIGAQLLLTRDDELDHALRMGVMIHLSDALSAALAGTKGQLPVRAAAKTTLISTVNVGLALAARDRGR
jgi:hypothetical protein